MSDIETKRARIAEVQRQLAELPQPEQVRDQRRNLEHELWRLNRDIESHEWGQVGEQAGCLQDLIAAADEYAEAKVPYPHVYDPAAGAREHRAYIKLADAALACMKAFRPVDHSVLFDAAIRHVYERLGLPPSGGLDGLLILPTLVVRRDAVGTVAQGDSPSGDTEIVTA